MFRQELFEELFLCFAGLLRRVDVVHGHVRCRMAQHPLNDHRISPLLCQPRGYPMSYPNPFW